MPSVLPEEGAMSSIQGVSASAASYLAPKPQVAAKSEAKETPQEERAEASRGTQEAGERQASSGTSTVGSKVNLTA
jgi:hypothetical protein